TCNPLIRSHKLLSESKNRPVCMKLSKRKVGIICCQAARGGSIEKCAAGLCLREATRMKTGEIRRATWIGRRDLWYPHIHKRKSMDQYGHVTSIPTYLLPAASEKSSVFLS